MCDMFVMLYDGVSCLDEVVDAVAWSADYPWLLVVGTR